MYHLMTTTLSVTYFIFWLRDKWSWLEILDGVVSAPGETTAISTQIKDNYYNNYKLKGLTTLMTLILLFKRKLSNNADRKALPNKSVWCTAQSHDVLVQTTGQTVKKITNKHQKR